MLHERNLSAGCPTLMDQLCLRATLQANGLAYAFLLNGEENKQVITFAELDLKARAIAGYLQNNTEINARALLLLPSSLDYLAAFFGCVYANVIAVPAYPPRPNHRSAPRIEAIVQDAKPTIIFTTRKALTELQSLEKLKSIKWVAVEDIDLSFATHWQKPVIHPDTIAYLQYTSGSTATPKGVIITHNNLIQNAKATQHIWQHSEKDVIVSWLPLHHDMGLIATALQSIYSGASCVLFSPAAFVQKPVRWLQAISHYRAKISGAPNFAYDLCVEKVTREQCETLDLSRWDIAFNAAEPVRHETLEKFAEKFAACGFKKSALYPFYGLAESTLFVSGGVFRSTEKGVVSCGPALMGQDIVIVDPVTKMLCAENAIGEIWLAGECSAQGYWQRPDETTETFKAQIVGYPQTYLRTGDLGFLKHNELYIAGRYKDIIIIHGRNHYPQDIEFTVEHAHPDLEPNNGAAIAIDVNGQEKCVVIQSVRRTALKKINIPEVVQSIREAVAREHDLSLYDVVLIKPGSVFKTSSGKIQRSACKKAYLENSLSTVDGKDLKASLIEILAKLCEVESDKINPSQSFYSYGLDSIKSIEFAELVSTRVEKSLPATLVYDFPSIDLLVQYLETTESSLRLSVSPSRDDDNRLVESTSGIAIVGLGCRFPGADHPEAFWQLLCDGVDAVSSVPPEREWQLDKLVATQQEKNTLTRGGFLKNIAEFDPQFFGISPREAMCMDPQQRILLEVAWEACVDAGLTKETLAGSNTGVFVGISSQEYSQLLAAETADIYVSTGTALSIAANRISYLFDLRGPSFAIDTACSSSLVAVHQACQGILNGEASLAIAGGVNLILTPERSLQFTKMNFLSPDGKCKTFDASANGYVRSEGVGVVILKSLAQAKLDNDDIYGVILGSAINQDGRTNGLTAPNQYSQEAVLRAAYAKAGVDTRDISYVEAHGTGTALGDPIEVKALNRVLHQAHMGSVKANIGHLEAAAGMAGLIKLALMAKYKKIPPQIHFQEPNPLLEIDKLQLKIATSLSTWHAPHLIAGVSSFGFGGTNAHVVVSALEDDNKKHKNKVLPQWNRQHYWIKKKNHEEIKMTHTPLQTEEKIVTELSQMLSELLRLPLDAIARDVPILEMGADSIVLIGAIRKIEVLFQVDITIRQFFGELNTLNRLANYISQNAKTIAMPPVIPDKKEPLRVSAWQTQKTERVSQQYTDSQQAHLDALIARYTQKTQRSKELTQAHRSWLADSKATVGFRFSTKEMLYPIIGKRTQGVNLWDVDDNHYVDISMGFGVHLFGYRPDFIAKTLANYAGDGIDLGPRDPIAGEVAKLMHELTGMERVVFTNSGTEAVMTALRLARAVTGRTKFVLFKHSYHGHSDYTLAEAQIALADGTLVPTAPGLPAYILQDVLVLEYGTNATLETILQHQHELAAVLVEPVQSRRPDLQPREFLQRLRQVTEAANVALIFDEMITGFRVHPGGAQAWFGVRADLATYGKILGGGLPIGAVAGSAKYLDGIDGGMWQYGDASYPAVERTFFGGTFCQHPLALQAAHAVLTHLKEQGPALQEQLNARTAKFADELNAYFAAEDLNLRIVYFSSLFRFAHDGNMDLFFYHLLEKGVYIWEWRNCFLSTKHTDADLEYVIRMVKETIAELRAGGFLPAKAVSPVASMLNQNDLGFLSRHQIKPSLLKTQCALLKPNKIRKHQMDFSLYYFGAYPAEFADDKYDLIFRSVRLGDEQGFKAAWIPERHFHEFGGFSPNPSVLCAALARETEQIQLRAGSVVLPLHHPARVAEEWALVDNLSQGRVGIAFASGWHSDDFVFAPDVFGKHRELMFENIHIVQQLWSGQTVLAKGGSGQAVKMKCFPMPKQKQLPSWITIVNNPETYVKAGELGLGVVTNLMGQSVTDLENNIALYRDALAKHHPNAAGHVVLLMHTLVGENLSATRELARQPFYDYLKSSLGLFKNLAQVQGLDIEWDKLSPEDMNFLLSAVYERYVTTSALIGTPDSCVPIVNALNAIGVDEIACFIDFGVNAQQVLQHFTYLSELKSRYPAWSALQTLPLCSSQRSRWLTIYQTERFIGPQIYNMSVCLKLQGEVDVLALEYALQAIVKRHAALRTTFDEAGIMQIVHPESKVALQCVDYAKLDITLQQWLNHENDKPFDLVQDQPIRLSLIKIAHDEYLLVLVVHHILADGWSIGILLKELMQFYSAKHKDQVCVLAQAVQYPDYLQAITSVEWQAVRAKNDAYWLKELSQSVPLLKLPYDYDYTVRRIHFARSVMIPMNPELMVGLKKFSQEQHVTLTMTLMAVFQVFLQRLTQQSEMIVLIPTNGRYVEGSDSMVGFANYTLPIRVTMQPNFAKHLQQVKEKMLLAYEHAVHSPGAVLEKLNHPTKPFPFSNVVFNVDSAFSINQFDNLHASWQDPPITYVNYELIYNFFEIDGFYWLECKYSSELFKPATIQKWLEEYENLLSNLDIRIIEERVC